jgi:hypothetical protein
MQHTKQTLESLLIIMAHHWILKHTQFIDIVSFSAALPMHHSFNMAHIAQVLSILCTILQSIQLILSLSLGWLQGSSLLQYDSNNQISQYNAVVLHLSLLQQ